MPPLILLPLLLVAAAPPPEPDAEDRAVVLGRLLDEGGPPRVVRWWRAVDYGMTGGSFIQKNYHVLRVQASVTGKRIDRVFVIEQATGSLYSSRDWKDVPLNQPTPESWYREEFENIYRNEKP